MSGPRARGHRRAALCGVLAAAFLAGALLCGCATSKRQCSGALEPINAPAPAAAAEERDEP
jgi:hypothetical protein